MTQITDYSNLRGFIWKDGELLDWSSCQIHFLSHSLHYGGCVFEGLRAYGGKIFELDLHSQRLLNSAELLGFKLPYNLDEISAACKEVLQANGISDGYIRPAAWRGSKTMGISAGKNPVETAVAAWEWPSYFDEEKLARGLRLHTSIWRRPSPGTAPVHSKASGLYMICTMARQEAEQYGFDDALMLDYRGFIAESTGANIFFFMSDGKLHTPIADCFLDGITRQTVIKIARAGGIEVVERHLSLGELDDAQEVFLTGTAIEIAPVSEISGFKFQPGELTASMIKVYGDLVRS